MTLAAPSDSVVKVCSPERVTLPSGGESPARISVVVADGFHVQADPASLEFLFPLRLQIRAKGGVRAKTPMYPPGQAYHLEGMPIDLMTYAGTFEILVTFQAGESARPGPATTRYAACCTSKRATSGRAASRPRCLSACRCGSSLSRR